MTNGEDSAFDKHAPTPRTDAEAFVPDRMMPGVEMVSAQLARQLERELAEARPVLDMLMLDGNVGPSLKGAAKLRAIIDALIEARASLSAARRSERCATQGHIWVGTGDERVVCDDCGIEKPKFENVSCSQCGRDFGPGNEGFSRCADHAPASSVPTRIEPTDTQSRLQQFLAVYERGFKTALPHRPSTMPNQESVAHQLGILSVMEAAEAPVSHERSNVPWIPCSERMPDDMQIVQVWVEHGEESGWTVAQWDSDAQQWHDRLDISCGEDINDGTVTHWQPAATAPHSATRGRDG